MPKEWTGKRGYFVIPTRDGWALREFGSTQAGQVYQTQAEAAKAARQRLRSKGGELRIQGKDGRWRESFTVGQEAIGKLNAIEGAYLTNDVRGAFREFDRQGLSPQEQRDALARRFSRKG